ncbi:hypothetical protein ACS0PU_011400 [Formica fusca]
MSWFNIIIIATAIVSMLVSLFRFKELKMCLHKLSIVDDTLEMLGTPKEYRRLYNWVIGIIVGWISLIFLINASDSLWLNYEYFSLTRICVPFVANHLVHVNTLNILIWVTILRYIESRFQRINEHIYDMLEYKRTKGWNTLQLISEQRREVKKYKQYIWILRHVHLQLCLISRELNKIFSLPMTLQMGCYFVIFVDVSRHIYRLYIDRNRDTDLGQVLDNLFTCIWGAVHNAKFLALNLICQTLCNKANETIAILYKLFPEDLEEDLQEQILQFILQIKQRELEFSGMGLFNFGYNFVRKFYASVVTVLVIIIQMHVPYPHHVIPPSNDKY